MKSCDVPHVHQNIKVYIHETNGGGYYIARILNVSSPAENEYYALVNLQRKYQDGKITPHDLSKNTWTIPLNVREIWEPINGK